LTLRWKEKSRFLERKEGCAHNKMEFWFFFLLKKTNSTEFRVATERKKRRKKKVEEKRREEKRREEKRREKRKRKE
jgi:hypothetical protein